MLEGKIPGRREVALKKVSRLLPRFLEQKHYAKAAGLLAPEWGKACKDMTLEEVIGRFIALSAPDIFAEHEKNLAAHHAPAAKPAHAPHAGKPAAHRPAPYAGHKPSPWKKNFPPRHKPRPH
jgi:hypothetical protein